MAKCEYRTSYIHPEKGEIRYECNSHALDESDKDGKKYCILHSTREDKDPDKFYLEFKNHYESKDHVFSHLVFPKDFNLNKLKRETGNLEFKDAYFWRTTFLGMIHFGMSIFSGRTDFREVNFLGRAYFGNTIFSGEVNFALAKFSERAHFGLATFSEKAYFGGVKLLKGANFARLKFLKEVSFNSAKLSGMVNFEGATFSKNADFCITTFEGESHFIDTTFLGNVNFAKSKFLKTSKVIFSEKTFNDSLTVYFQDLNIDKEAEIIFDVVNLNRARFLGTNLERINFNKVYWCGRKYKSSSYLGRIKVFDEKFQYRGRFFRIFQRDCFLLKNWLYKLKQRELNKETENRYRTFLENKVSKIIKRFKIKKPVEKEENHYEVYRLYNQLLKNYQNTNRYHEAGDFFAGMMEMRRREAFEKRRIRITLWFYRLFSLYGERPTFVLGWLVILWLFFGLVFLHKGLVPSVGYDKYEEPKIVKNVLVLESYKDPMFKKEYLEALNYSLNILTLGRIESEYKVFKRDYTFLLIGFETIFGAVFLSLFILAMNRKFRRTKD